MRPLQGGEVLFVGARVTNVDACGLQLTGALRDEETQQVRFDTRTINLIPTGDGWGVTGTLGANVAGLISNFSNVPVCPNEWSTTDVDGHEYGLEVTITDSGRADAPQDDPRDARMRPGRLRLGLHVHLPHRVRAR